jgi:hypothetical protein
MPSILKPEETERRSRNQIVLVLDSKRISRSAACTSGNFEIGIGLHFGQRFQPVEHEHEHENILATCIDLLGE